MMPPRDSQVRLRVAMLSLHFAEYSLRLACALRRAGADVLLVVYEDNARNELGNGWQAQAEQAGLVPLVLPRARTPWQVLVNALKLRRAIRHFCSDVVHVQEALRDELILALGLRGRRPVVLTVHDPEPHLGRDAARLRWSRRALYRRYLRQTCALAITHGAQLAQALVRVAPWLHGRVRIAPHGPLGGSNVEAQLPPAALRLLFFGRIEVYKGLRYLVDAVLLLRERGLDVRATVAGRGPELAVHRERMERSGAFEIRDAYIPADEVPQLFLGCTAVVLPYVEGTQSGVAAMAMGFGRPVVATRVGSIPELVREGINGRLVPPADAQALAEVIASTAAEPGGFERLAHGARALARGALGWDAIARDTLGMYAGVVIESGRTKGASA